LVAATRKSLEVMQHLHEAGPATVTEIAATLPYSKSTIHRHLRTLEHETYVVEGDDGWRVSLLYLDYGLATRGSSAFYQAIEPKLEELAAETGEKVWAMVEEHGFGVFVANALGPRAIETYARVGERGYLHHFAGGKAILGFLPEARVAEILERRGIPARTGESITTQEELFDELEQIRADGVAFNREESVNGVNAVGVPVLDAEGVPVGAISVAGPVNRLQGAYFEDELPSLLRGVANEVEIQLSISASEQ
jgi:DNA-binding IclR family transcriptional regulator